MLMSSKTPKQEQDTRNGDGMRADGWDGLIENGKWNLPGFAATREYLARKGLSFAWVDQVVDRDSPGAVFLKFGKPGYLSSCPHYEGFWLSGGIGSVQCSKAPFLLPGLQLYETCDKHPDRCLFQVGRQGHEDPNMG